MSESNDPLSNSSPAATRASLRTSSAGRLSRRWRRNWARRLAALGGEVERAHTETADGHGFIDSQRRGLEVFRGIDPTAPLIIAEAVWQYTHHVLAGLTTHRGPILTVANWSGQWPGLVGMLNLNGSLTKAGVSYSTLWSEDFKDEYFVSRLRQWLQTGELRALAGARAAAPDASRSRRN